MKALNRAIARTVSQIARHAGEGCHVPMIMALENHLDALLTMERKMLEGVQEVEWPDGQYLTTERGAAFQRWENVQPPKHADGKAVADWMRELERVKAPIQHANENAQEPPSLSPFQWMAGDKVVFVGSGEPGFTKGNAYVIEGIDALAGSLRIIDDIGNVREIFSHNWIAANLRNCSKRGEQAPPAPDVIDMEDPANWQGGDIVLRVAPTFGAEFQECCEYVVASVSRNNKMVCIYRHDGGTRAYQFDLLRRDHPFQWLRHSEVQS